ncbi:hypothetical protein NBRC116602_09440 [Hyphomicrobiales bacterium 4NK60-0047b]|jgi:hypothetical protein
MTSIKTTRRDFIKNSVITSAVTGSMIAVSSKALAIMPSNIAQSVSKNRVNPVLNQANMFDLPEAYAMAWTQTAENDSRLSL